MRRHAFVDGGYDGRPAFAGIRYPAREARRRRIVDQPKGSSSQEAITLPRHQTSVMSGRFRSY